MLTDFKIKQTQSDPSKRITLTDGQGLQLRITPKDVRSWSLQYRRGGQMKKMSLGHWPTINCIKARKLANEARYLLAQGIDPQVERQKALVTKLRVTEIWVLYDKMHIANAVKEKTAKDYRRSGEKDILPVLGKLFIDEVEKSVIVKLIDTIASRAPVMANRTLGLLRHFFDWCVGRGYIDMNPAAGIPKPVKEVSRQRILTLTEMQRLYEASSVLSAGNRLFLRLLLLTGQREGVIANLTRDELKEGFLEISGERNKSGQRIRIPLSAIAQRQIELLGSAEGHFLDSNTGGAKPISGFSKLKKKIDLISGVTDWRFHDIRRGLATHLEDCGVDRFYVERVLTHKDRSVTGIYAKSDHFEIKRNILESWAQKLVEPNAQTRGNVFRYERAVS